MWLQLDTPFQIEDLSQQAQVQAAEKFKTTEPAPAAEGAPSTVSQPIQEESDEEEVRV